MIGNFSPDNSPTPLLGNKVRKILELEMNIPTSKSHAIFTITCEHKTKDHHQVRSQILFFNIAGLNHSKEYDVSNSLKNLETLVMESASTNKNTGEIDTTLLQVMLP